MCDVVVWTVNAAAFTPEFERCTLQLCGVSPQRTPWRPESNLVRPNSVTFTLTRNGCDCDAAVGSGGRAIPTSEISAQDLSRWVRESFARISFLATLSVVWAWDPENSAIQVRTNRVKTIGDFRESDLLDLKELQLLQVVAHR